mmetsp:Transcript_8364/g.18324  ORF Transcript_8364/g.18324 Transcript_8364/m.18324 type:complete len:402 (-) Transcript_8364:9-1214(-)
MRAYRRCNAFHLSHQRALTSVTPVSDLVQLSIEALHLTGKPRHLAAGLRSPLSRCCDETLLQLLRTLDSHADHVLDLCLRRLAGAGTLAGRGLERLHLAGHGSQLRLYAATGLRYHRAQVGRLADAGGALHLQGLHELEARLLVVVDNVGQLLSDLRLDGLRPLATRHGLGVLTGLVGRAESLQLLEDVVHLAVEEAANGPYCRAELCDLGPQLACRRTRIGPHRGRISLVICRACPSEALVATLGEGNKRRPLLLRLCPLLLDVHETLSQGSGLQVLLLLLLDQVLAQALDGRLERASEQLLCNLSEHHLLGARVVPQGCDLGAPVLALLLELIRHLDDGARDVSRRILLRKPWRLKRCRCHNRPRCCRRVACAATASPGPRKVEHFHKALARHLLSCDP